MIYTTGTIAIAGNSLTGTGTNFTAAGSLIRVGCTLVTLANPIQVFQITAINSATQLTVTPAANPAIAAGTAYAILLSDSLSVDGLAQNIAETLTLYQRNMSGFADVMNGAGDVTITTNGAAITVPGQKSLAKKGANSDITSLNGLTTPLSPAQGGTGLIYPFGTTPGTFCPGNDNRLNTVEGKTGGTINGSVYLRAASPAVAPATGTETVTPLTSSGWNSGVYNGAQFLFHGLAVQGAGSKAVIAIQPTSSSGYTRYQFDQFGSATAPGTWISNSDERLKTNIERIADPLEKMQAIRGVSWKRLDGVSPGIGFIAQEVKSVFPDNVFVTGDRELDDGTVIKNVLSPDTAGVAAALHHEAILALMAQIEALTARVAALEPKKSEEPAAE
ncbi:tail fiber domain-containing protein [Phytobacter diazotrophicus]|uniref:tail fiber domain-containing protein n=1 Tax=Phytobacter diazotrophicus TaxID=395631 RepID=UPI002FFC2362